MPQLPKDPGFRITALYLCLGAAWILFSDQLLGLFIEHPQQLTQFQTYKGWGFVLLTSLLLYLLIRRDRRADALMLDQLKRREEQLTLTHKVAQIGTWEWHAGRGRGRWSAETEMLYGLQPGTFRGTQEDWFALIHPDDREDVQQAIDDWFKQPKPFNIEYRIVRPDGEERWLLSHGDATFDDQGRPERLLGINMDITERKRTELALSEREELLQKAQQLARIGYWYWDFHQDRTFWSPGMYRLLGRDPSLPPANYREVADYFSEESWEALSHAVQQCIQQQKPYALDLEVRHPDGERRWVVARGEPYCNSDGETTQLRGFMQDISERKQSEESLRQSEERYRTVLDFAADAVFVIDPHGRFTYVNQFAAELLDYSPESLRHMTIPQIVSEKDIPHALEQFRLLQEKGVARTELNLRRSDTSVVPVEVNAVSLPDGNYYAACRDITLRLASEAHLHQAAAVYENSRDGIIVTDPRTRILAINPAFSEITGYSEKEVIGQTPRILKSEHHPRSFYQQMWRSIRQTGGWSGEIWNRRKGDGIYPEWLSISSVCDSNGEVTNYVGVFSDLTQLKRSEEEVQHLSNHDALTGLPNGRQLHARLEHAISRARHSGQGLAVLLLDIDRFKDINDSLGLHAGDALLKETAQRVVDCLWESDTVARMGGDELVVLIEELRDPGHAMLVAEKLRNALSASFIFEEQELFLTASIGISLYPDNGDNAELLLREADAALYRAKEEGRNRVAFYTESLSQMASKRLTLEAGLRHALERGEFELHYQPQLLLHTRQLAGVEALIRWRHPEDGLIPPNEFIPLAEKSGLIEPIGEWVLAEGCRQIAAWRDAGINIPRVAINLSAGQLGRRDLVTAVERTLRQHSLSPEMLELELTETAIMHDPARATETLDAMTELGIAMAIDDFGTGYSSLAYLQKFRLQRLKIDMAFVRDTPQNSGNAALCRAIIAMAQSLGMETIAEGIEEEAQQQFLASEGCTIGQGWLYARAMPAAELEQWLSQHQSG